MSTYVGLGLALAIIAGIVFMAMGSTKEKPQIMVTMDDVKTEGKPDLKEISKKDAKKQENKPKEDEDWSSDDAVDEDGIYKALDQGGPFVRTITGTLEPESMLMLRQIIVRYAARAFQSRKDDLFEERLELLKAKKFQEYSECLQ